MDGTSIKEIEAYAHNQHKELHLQYYNFQKHFANHMEYVVSEKIKTSKLRDEVVKESIKKDIEVARRISRNLEIVGDKIDELSEDLSSPDKQAAFLNFIDQSRLLIEQFLKWGDKLDIKDTNVDTFAKIMKCIEDFPADLIAKFAERWKYYDENSS